MTGRTHLTLGIASGLLIAAHFHTDTVLTVAAGALGALLPDIDHPQSIISGWIPGSGIVGLLGVRHRGFTHSLVFILLILAGWFAASQRVFIPYVIVGAFCAGILTHFAGDMLTPQGIPLLYPHPAHWKLAPGIILRAGKFIGLIELAVWLAGLAGIALGVYALVTKTPI